MAVRQASTQYDLWAAGYDRRWRRYTARTHAALLARADLSHATTVVDVGCGTGELERRVLTRWPHLHIIGVEPSAGMRRVTAAKLAPLRAAGGHVTILDGAATALPLPDASVDAVVLASVLHYLAAPLQALLEARRVLRQGGQLLLVDYVPRCLPITLADTLIRLYDSGHQHTRSPAALAHLLARTGFSIDSTESFPIYPCMDGVAFRLTVRGRDEDSERTSGSGTDYPHMDRVLPALEGESERRGASDTAGARGESGPPLRKDSGRGSTGTV